ncbi:MAG TPA: alpha/beta fold hydrolase [Herpetosiphonaceae bacterium]
MEPPSRLKPRGRDRRWCWSGGALQHRALDRMLGQRRRALAQHMTVVAYDRRGRGASGDTAPYAAMREIEDLAAVIDAHGAPVTVLGLSSGGALALEAAMQLGPRIRQLILFEVPYNDDPAARAAWRPFAREVAALLAGDRREDALRCFLQHFGTPPEQCDAMRASPAWPLLVAAAPTLAYDLAILGEENAVPSRHAAIRVPTHILVGGATFPFVADTARALAALIPQATSQVLAGQTHAVGADALVEAVRAALPPAAG